MMDNIIIRPFRKDDRESVRRISCETAFWGKNRKNIFADDEILADALTMYFTDYEPESCFVASVGEVCFYTSIFGSYGYRHKVNELLLELFQKKRNNRSRG